MKSALISVLLLISPCLRAAEFPVMKLGASLPDFSLPGADGRTYTPKDFADAKLLAIIFTSNHCPTAQLTSCKCINADFT